MKLSIRKIKFLVILVFCFYSFNAFSQTVSSGFIEENRQNRGESAVQQMIQSHRLRLGMFRIQPSLSINSGYDSNALYREDNEVGDYFFIIIPEASVGLRLGRKSFFRIIESLHLLYYRKLEQRRDIFNTTKAEFVTGAQRWLATVGASYYKSQYPFDVEVDVPIDQEVIEGGINMEYTLTTRFDLRSTFRASRINLQEIDEINDLPINLFDRDTVSAGAGIDYELKNNVFLIGDLLLARTKEPESGITTDSWAILGGIQISETRVGDMRRRFYGRVALGYGESFEQESTRKNFLIDGSVGTRLGKRLRLQAFASRRYESSALLENALRLTTQVGGWASIPLTERFSLYGSYAVGKNDYGDNPVGGEVIENDRFQKGDFGLNVRIVGRLFLQAGGTYLKRDTDIPGFEKEQLTYGIGLGYRTSF